MSTGRNWKAVAAAAGFIFTLFFTGCGGGDDPVIVAPASLETRSYNLNKASGQSVVTFTSSSDYTFQQENGTLDQGTYEALRNGNNWTVSLINTNGGKEVYGLNFTSPSGGDFRLRRDGEADQVGTFSARSSGDPGPTTDGSTTDGSTTNGSTTDGTTTSGQTTTGPSNEYLGFAPASISGRTMEGTRTFTSTGPFGQTHTYTFSGAAFHDSDAPEEADGQYLYSASNSAATLTLVYNSPGFAGDRHQLSMTFTQKDKGTFTSTYTRGDGTTITINGTFQFTPIGQ